VLIAVLDRSSGPGTAFGGAFQGGGRTVEHPDAPLRNPTDTFAPPPDIFPTVPAQLESWSAMPSTGNRYFRNWAAFPHPDRIDIPDLAARFLFRCELDHRAMCSSISMLLGAYPISGREDVSSFGSSGAEYFGGMAQECVRWLPGCIGPGLVADPGSVTADKIIQAVA
jgi:hypothetical protein